MAFERRDTFFIPVEFRDLPEAERAREVEAEFLAALEREKSLVRTRVHMISEELQLAQKRMQESRDAFDAAAGLPVPAPLTPQVTEEVARLFPNDQREVTALLEKRCGRTIPFQRDSDPISLEPYRLCVLRESKGDFTVLLKWIDAANVLGREILMT